MTAPIENDLTAAYREYAAGNLERALGVCEAILSREPDLAPVLHLAGISALALGRGDDAIRLLRRAVAVAPQDADAENALSAAFQAKGETREALAAAGRALRLRPDFADAENRIGVILRGLGRTADALAVFSEAAARHPAMAEIQDNLAVTLHESGRVAEAAEAFRCSLDLAPDSAVAWAGLGAALLALGQKAEALDACRAALAREPDNAAAALGLGHAQVANGAYAEAVESYAQAAAREPDLIEAHLGIFAAAQIAGDLPRALRHQNEALARQRLYVEPSLTAPATRKVLILLTPGPWAANVPLDFVLDRSRATFYKLYLLDERAFDDLARLDDYDLVFNAIAESDEARPCLDLADRLARAQAKPVLNAPAIVRTLSRDGVTARLDGAAGVRTARICRLDRGDLAPGRIASRLAKAGIAWPFLIRPVMSQAGVDLAKVGSPAELESYLAKTVADAFYLSAFVDYRSTDGYFRKYRVIFVAGEAYPCHLAISREWMVHYYNAGMYENAWMRDEERRFLADIRAAFGADQMRALAEIAARIGLDYFGIDCAIMPDGQVLVFEADPAMIVHVMDPIEVFPYKHQYVPRIFQAVMRLIECGA